MAQNKSRKKGAVLQTLSNMIACDDDVDDDDDYITLHYTGVT